MKIPVSKKKARCFAAPHKTALHYVRVRMLSRTYGRVISFQNFGYK
jgi:hypothetical protein